MDQRSGSIHTTDFERSRQNQSDTGMEASIKVFVLLQECVTLLTAVTPRSPLRHQQARTLKKRCLPGLCFKRLHACRFCYSDRPSSAHPVVNRRQFSDPSFGVLHDVTQKQLELCVDGPVTFIPFKVMSCPAAAGQDPHRQRDAAAKRWESAPSSEVMALMITFMLIRD